MRLTWPGVAISLAIALDQAVKHLLTSTLHSPHLPAPLVGALLVVLLVWTYRAARISALRASGLLAMIAGGVSNLIDQAYLGFVLDPFTLAGLWFNLADLYLVGGSLLVLISPLSRKPHVQYTATTPPYAQETDRQGTLTRKKGL